MGEPLQSSHDVYSVTQHASADREIKFLSRTVKYKWIIFFFLGHAKFSQMVKNTEKDSAKILNRHKMYEHMHEEVFMS